MAEDIGSLEAELIADTRPQRRRCVVCIWLESRTDADEWDRAFRNELISARAIQRKMEKLGASWTADPVLTHRNEQHRVG